VPHLNYPPNTVSRLRKIRIKILKEGCFIDDSEPTEIDPSKSTLYATHPKSRLNIRL